MTAKEGAGSVTVAAAVVDAIVDAGVTHVFGIPGVHNIDLYEALAADGRLAVVSARHEQGVVFMADGYARATGGVGVAFLITGPGVTNGLTAIGEAFWDSSAIAVFATEIGSAFIGQGKGFVHELPNQLGMVSQVSKSAVRLERAGDAGPLTATVLRIAAHGRRRPVYVELPLDLLPSTVGQDAAGAVASARDDRERAVSEAAEQDIDQALTMLRQAKSPLLYVGGGLVSPQGRDSLRRFCELTGTPVLTTVKGKAAFPADHPLAVGASSWAAQVTQSSLLREADLVLAVGTRLSARFQRNVSAPIALPERLIHIDPDELVIGQNYPTALGIVADGATTLDRIGAGYTPDDAVREMGHQRARRAREAVAHWLATEEPVIAGFLSELRKALPRETIFVGDNALAGIWTARYFPIYEPGQFLFPMGFATLGFAVPAAIGARFGRPDRPVVALVGDGGFLFSAQELAVAAQHGLDLTVILVNDRRYGSVYFNQQQRFGRAFASKLWNPDFERLAAAFACGYQLVKEPTAIGRAVTQAMGDKGVQIIEVDGSFFSWY